MAELDCLIVLDAFITPTVEAAHVALPISSPAETDGTITNLEGRVQWLRAGTPPAGEARQGGWVLTKLAAALGMPWSHESVDDVLRQILATVPLYGAALSPEVGTREGFGGVLPGVFPDVHTRAAEAEDAGRSILRTTEVATVGRDGEGGATGPPTSRPPPRPARAGRTSFHFGSCVGAASSGETIRSPIARRRCAESTLQVEGDSPTASSR